MLASDTMLINNIVNNGIPVLKTEFCGVVDYWMITKFSPSGELGSDDEFHSIEGYNITPSLENIFLGSDLIQRVMDFTSQNALLKVKIHKECKYMYFTHSSKNKLNPLNNVI